jgi:hypothetical protein
LSRERDRSHPTDAFGLPEGLLAAIVAAVLLIGAFAVISAATPMPPAEYWAALTTFSLLALGTTLPGCAALYDALGRAVRRDWRAMAVLAALVPALYLAYAGAVRELSWQGAVAAALFAGVPALAFGLAGQRREPTPLEFVALAYLLVSLAFGLLPALTLPQQGPLAPFFPLAVVPLLLLLFAWRGWPGLGYSWHLGPRELRDALIAALAATAALAAVELLAAGPALGEFGGNALTRAVAIYFFLALPVELLLRGGVQNGLERLLRERAGGAAPWLALAVAALLSALAFLPTWGADLDGLLSSCILGLAAGWAYMRSGKVTLSAVAVALPVWIISLLFGS